MQRLDGLVGQGDGREGGNKEVDGHASLLWNGMMRRIGRVDEEMRVVDIAEMKASLE